jgi:hypothetical protein
MARRIRTPGTAALVDGPIARTIGSLAHCRLTSYQDLCLRLGELAIDLPTARVDSMNLGQQPLHRHTDRYPSGIELMPWVLDVAEQNLLAAMVLLDALNWYVEILDFIVPSRMHRFPESREKKEWTERVGDYFVEFEVQKGWEFESCEKVHTVGHRGVACVSRCHLSDNWYQSSRGSGRLVGLSGCGVELAVGFDIPCEYFPALRVEAETLQVNPADEAYGYGISLPYAFVTRAFRRPWDAREKLAFIIRPTDDEVITLAQESVNRIQGRWRQQAGSYNS